MKELQKDYTSCKISTLCTRRKSWIDVICFAKAGTLQSFAWKFDVMTKQVNSSIFDTKWSAIMKMQARMSISDIEVQVWTPTFNYCLNLLEQLHNLSMTLADVDRCFATFSEEQLVHELTILSAGVDMCLMQPHDDRWIRQSVHRVAEYRKLRDYRNAANSFLKLKDSLNLMKGDFRVVKRISKEVNFRLKWLIMGPTCISSSIFSLSILLFHSVSLSLPPLCVLSFPLFHLSFHL